MRRDLQELYSDFADPNEDLPPELLLNPEHPDNDRYFQSLEHINRAVTDAAAKLRPLQKHAVLLYRTGLNDTEVAKKLDCSPQAVSGWVNSKQGRRLVAVVDHQQRLKDGPNFEHRKAILYRIALEQERAQPKTTIAAIQEINKMTGVYAENALGGINAGGDVNISINGDLLPRGALDVMPNTYETRQAALTVDGDFREV